MKPYDQLRFTEHALMRMAQRGFTRRDVRQVLDSGEVIKAYPDDLPYPSRLVLGRLADQPVHVVVADDGDHEETVVVTIYEPDPKRWTDDFRTRLPGSHE